MTVDEYTSLTGLQVPSSQSSRVAAQIERARTIVETLIGFTLQPDQVAQNLYNERGKAKSGWSWGVDIDTEDLLPADPVVNAYRVFPVEWAEPYLHIDPCSAVHAIKVVRDDVTVCTLGASDYRVQTGRDRWCRFIDVGPSEMSRLGLINVLGELLPGLDFRTSRVQVAVDADWLWGIPPRLLDENDEPTTEGADYRFASVPADLMYVWADIAAHYSDARRGIKSQTVGSHSYTRDTTAPENLETNMAILRQYVGPYGSLNTTVGM